MGEGGEGKLLGRLARGALVRGTPLAPRWLSLMAAVIALGVFAGMLAPAFQPMRGLVQRSAELALFGWLLVAGWHLWRLGHEAASLAAPSASH